MLSSHPCSSEGVLLLPFGLADVDDVDVGCVLCVRFFGLLLCLCTFKMEAFTWPFMAVAGGRRSMLEGCICCGSMWMAHPDQADSLQG